MSASCLYGFKPVLLSRQLRHVDEHFGQVDRGFEQVDLGFAQMLGKFDATTARQQRIAELIESLIDQRDR